MNGVSNRPSQADRPLADLLRDLTTEVKTLVHDELELVKIEMTRKGKKAGESAGFFGATTLLALGAFVAFTERLTSLTAPIAAPENVRRDVEAAKLGVQRGH